MVGILSEWPYRNKKNSTAAAIEFFFNHKNQFSLKAIETHRDTMRLKLI
jgi:hypothetical protein